MELVNLANGSVSDRYEYGAIGETISVDGDAIADANPIRFSTKYLDGETGLLYYTHRYYDAGKGRWPSRDPIEEAGGNNLYGMVGNDSVNNVDYLGLNEFGTPQNPVSPYDIAVGTTKTIANEKGLHVTDCCFWVGADGKPGSGIGNREGWLRWHLGYWGDQGFATPTVRQAFATDLVDGLGLTSSLIYGGNVQYVIKLRRNSESNYTWILDWTAFDLDKSWLKSTVGAKKCEKFTPAKISNTKEVSGDVFGASPKPTPPKPQIPNPTPKQPLP
jgi:RHS repeat-associated protein